MEGQQPPPSSGGQSEPPYRLRVLSEPKGFLRIIEFFLAILMFSTTAGFSDSFTYGVTCAPGGQQFLDTVPYTYPFKLYTHKYPVYCNALGTTTSTSGVVPAEPEGSAKFFVCIGVLAMLYCMALIAWYVFLEVKFLNLEIVPLLDTAITAVFSLLFFIGSCAWSAGVNDVKYWSTYKNIENKFYKETCALEDVTCELVKSGGYAGLNVSLIFGFLNCGVWAATVWFTLKETAWFRARMDAKAKQQPQGLPPEKPNMEVPPANQV